MVYINIKDSERLLMAQTKQQIDNGFSKTLWINPKNISIILKRKRKEKEKKRNKRRMEMETHTKTQTNN